MLFASPIFLFIFLPIVLAIYFTVGKRFKNFILLIFSIFFYSWGQTDFIGILLLMILLNYFFGLKIQNNLKKSPQTSRIFLWIIVLVNLALLAYFKYRFFILQNVSLSGRIQDFLKLNLPFLPLAISFFTFHAISYNIDIFRKESKAEKSLAKLALYFLLFPHLIAGPILRFSQIKKQLDKRFFKLENFTWAINRFIMGLAKKLVIADRLGGVTNEIFAIPTNNLSTVEAWLGIVCFTLQIYFDFSGYSDMAIALAKMFGFDFPENFNYPYISSSIQEFWRRWNITLSNWLRDYVYIPLGGSRVATYRIYLNLMIVFLICGLWHGASWNFVIWGAIHGTFLIIERIKGGFLVHKLWKPIRHLYVLLVVILSWVFFRANSFDYAINFLKKLFGFGKFAIEYRSLDYFLTNDLILVLIVAILISLPFYPNLTKLAKLVKIPYLFSWSKLAYLIFLGFLSLLMIAAQTYRAFLYFRF